MVPAFPFKSPNTEKKTLSKLPDKGEELALETLTKFISEIKDVYPPGGKLSLVSDGRVFCDIYNVTDEVVTEYNKVLKIMRPDLNHLVEFHSLESLLHGHDNFGTSRDKLIHYYAKSNEALEKMIKTDDNVKRIYLGFFQFYMEEFYNYMEEDRKALTTKFGLSLTKMRSIAKEKSRLSMKRNEAYSNMVSDLFPLHVRLSIHAHNNSGPKFAIRLLPTDKVSQSLVSDKNLHIPTPWHNAVVEDLNGKWFLVKRYRVDRWNMPAIVEE